MKLLIRTIFKYNFNEWKDILLPSIKEIFDEN